MIELRPSAVPELSPSFSSQGVCSRDVQKAALMEKINCLLEKTANAVKKADSVQWSQGKMFETCDKIQKTHDRMQLQVEGIKKRQDERDQHLLQLREKQETILFFLSGLKFVYHRIYSTMVNISEDQDAIQNQLQNVEQACFRIEEDVCQIKKDFVVAEENLTMAIEQESVIKNTLLAIQNDHQAMHKQVLCIEKTQNAIAQTAMNILQFIKPKERATFFFSEIFKGEIIRSFKVETLTSRVPEIAVPESLWHRIFKKVADIVLWVFAALSNALEAVKTYVKNWVILYEWSLMDYLRKSFTQ